MRTALLSFALLTMGFASTARGTMLLYDNTTTDTFDTVFYSVGPYLALGDQIHLVSAGTATQAKVELFNGGGAGTFDAELDFFDVGSPVGALLGKFNLTAIPSTGLDVIDLTYNLLPGGLVVSQDLIFAVRITDMSSGMDLGVDMFEPPTTGSSDNTFMIAETSGSTYTQLTTDDENVYFQLSGTPISLAPEASSLALLGAGLLVMGIGSAISSNHGYKLK